MNFKAKNCFDQTHFPGIFLSLVLLILLNSCQAQVPEEKINGVSLVASREAISISNIKPILNVNANTVAVMPFGFLQSLDSPELKFNMERQWWGGTIGGRPGNGSIASSG